jgi:endonuclease VIII
MPEGPSILLVRESLQSFKGKKVLSIKGNSKIDQTRLISQKIKNIESWGKHLLICFDNFFLRIHFLMFGTYLVNETKSTPLRLSLKFKKGEINFYTCSVRIVEGSPDEIYDFSSDVLNENWNTRKASQKLRMIPEKMVCDALLDQEIFAGVGNIIKNEVLFRIRVHPKSLVGKLPVKLKSALIREARNYSFDFLLWRRNFVLKKNYLIYTKKTCPRDHGIVYKEYLGDSKRRTFFCDLCQVLYE